MAPIRKPCRPCRGFQMAPWTNSCASPNKEGRSIKIPDRACLIGLDSMSGPGNSQKVEEDK
jgi:hypothetical protein